MAAVYDGAVSYADAWFGLLVEELEQRDLWEDSLVIVLSDHGESLGDVELAVPLQVKLPAGEQAGRRVSQPVALLDVLPTALELAGASPPAGIHGRSLLELARGEEPRAAGLVFSEGLYRAVSVRAPEGRLVFSGVAADSPWLVDLLSATPLDGPAFEADPGLAPERARQLRGSLLEWRARLRPTEGEAADPELGRSLREHGYWEVQ